MSAMIFINNKYTAWYNNIISSAKLRTNYGYTERHHIIPKSLGGDNSEDNLVDLTAREHFVCHWLLTKMVSGISRQKMCYALHAMGHLLSGNRYINSRAFESNKIECANLRRIARKGILVGEKNYNYGKRWTEEQRAKMSEFRTGKCFRPEFKYSEESKDKMRESANKRWTKEERAKFSAKKIATMFVFTCPHCNKTGRGKTNFNRWHGDNCKILKLINS